MTADFKYCKNVNSWIYEEKVRTSLPNFAKRASCMLCTSSQDQGFAIGTSKIEYEIEGDVVCIVSLSAVLK